MERKSVNFVFSIVMMTTFISLLHLFLYTHTIYNLISKIILIQSENQVNRKFNMQTESTYEMLEAVITIEAFSIRY